MRLNSIIEKFTTPQPDAYNLEMVTKAYHIKASKTTKFAGYLVYTQTKYNPVDQSKSDIQFSDTQTQLNIFQNRFVKSEDQGGIEPLFSSFVSYKISDIPKSLQTDWMKSKDTDKNVTYLCYFVICKVGDFINIPGNLFQNYPEEGQVEIKHYSPSGVTVGTHNIEHIQKSEEKSSEDINSELGNRSDDEKSSNNLLLYILLAVLVVLCIVMLILLNKRK